MEWLVSMNKKFKTKKKHFTMFDASLNGSRDKKILNCNKNLKIKNSHNVLGKIQRITLHRKQLIINKLKYQQTASVATENELWRNESW